MSELPLASIGVPVFNEARYIERTVGSLLAQDYGNIEVVITDNGSTDATELLCRKLVGADPRIRYQRWPDNRGAIRSFRDVLDRAAGVYFCWVGGHDRLAADYVSRCVARLRERDDCILAYSFFQHIDQDDGDLDVFTSGPDTMAIDDPLARVKHVVWNMKGHIVCGVWRREELIASEYIANEKWGWDPVLVAELALRGRYAEIQEPLIYFRTRPEEGLEERKRRVLKTLNPASYEERKQRTMTALYREQRSLIFRIVMATDNSLLRRLRACGSIWACFALRHNAVPLAGLFRRAAQTLLPLKLRRALYFHVQKWI